MKFLLGFLKHFPVLVMLPVQMCHKYKLGRNKLSVNFLAYLNKGSGMLFLKQHISEQSLYLLVLVAVRWTCVHRLTCSTAACQVCRIFPSSISHCFSSSHL